MASVFGVICSSFLRKRYFSHERIASKIWKYGKTELSEQLNDIPDKILETMSPLLDANELSQDVFFHVRNEMINKHIIPEESVDTRILDLCLKLNKPQIAKSYFKCLKSNGHSLNIYALARYLNVYSFEDLLSKSEENEIINIVERIKKECEPLPEFLLKVCVVVLCRTHKWKMSLELLEDEDVFKEQSTLVLLHIIPAAFRNGDISVGLTLLNEVEDPHYGSNKHSPIYTEYLNYYLQNNPAELDIAIQKIFSFWRKHDIVPTKSIIDHFVNTCNNAGWETKYVTIKRDGKCYHCGEDLSATAINDSTFRKLAKDVISRALIDTDIFQSTTPHELSKFKNFIYKTKPYDIVIDGLNVSCGNQNKSWLKDMIDYFSQKNKKILVIARQHLYPSTKWILPLENVYVYFLQDTTKDDPYVLYATLQSGNDAKFVTIDLLRQHFHKLGNRKIRRRFRRWQYTHQYTWSSDNSSRKFELIEPWLYEPFAQYNNGYWHIPYRMDSEKHKLLYRPVDTWICFRVPKK